MESFNQRLSQTNTFTNEQTSSPRPVVENILIQNDQSIKTKLMKNTNKNFTGLILSFGGSESYNCDISESGVSDMKFQLKSLNLLRFDFEIPQNPLISSFTFREIAESLGSQFNLESLNIKIDAIQPSCDEGFAALENSFKSLTCLENLVISITNCNEESSIFSKQNAEFLKSAISQLETLKNLELNFECSRAITNEFIGEVLSGVKAISKLFSLHLKFGGIGYLNNKSATVIGKHLGEFKNLYSLHLDLQNNTDISTAGVKALIKGLKNMKALRELTLNWAALYVENQALNYMKAELNELRKLNSFRINLDYCKELSLIGYLAIRELLVNYGELKRIEFSLHKTLLTEQAFAGLCGAIIVFENLEELRINLGACINMSERSLKILIDTFPYLKKLKILRLGLNYWEDSLTDQGLISIMDGLIPMRQIRNFELGLLGCQKITNYGMRMMRDFLMSFNRLVEININISECREIMVEGLTYLTEGLINLKGLRTFVFAASGCPHLGESLLVRLKEILFYCTLIDYLDLEIDGLGKMTDKELNYLKEGVCALNKLTFFRLVFDDSYAVMLKADKFKAGVAKVHQTASIDAVGKVAPPS